MAEDLDPVHQFRELYEREYPSVYRAVRGVVLDPAAAEDVTQEAFVRAFRARHRYRPTAPVGAWLHRIAINQAISYLRRRKLAALLPEKLFVPPEQSDYNRAEARDMVEALLSPLSPKLRAALILHYYHGYTREEVAKVLGVPEGTVASRIAKAIAIMRRKSQKDDRHPEPVRSRG